MGTGQIRREQTLYGPRAVPPALGNDPTGKCDPLGLVRNLLLEVSVYPTEIIQTPKRVLQLFEWAHSWREIWTDGRELPKDPEPRWMGYSVGKWEGDTFVVRSVGFDDRTWLDHFGYPHSDQMRLEERYRRLDHDNLEFTITLTDPKTYTTDPFQDMKSVVAHIHRHDNHRRWQANLQRRPGSRSRTVTN